jgi:hypothetical protein
MHRSCFVAAVPVQLGTRIVTVVNCTTSGTPFSCNIRLQVFVKRALRTCLMDALSQQRGHVENSLLRARGCGKRLADLLLSPVTQFIRAVGF